jgi:hypothetical protein
MRRAVRLRESVGEEQVAVLPRSAALAARADAEAVAAAPRWPAWLLALLLLDAGAVLVLVAVGELVGDPAFMLRELAPGTWLSAFQLGCVSVAAAAVHRRHPRASRRWHGDFWGLSAAVFVLLALDELTQATVFLGHYLERTEGWEPVAGFQDIDAILLVLLFGGCAAVMLSRAAVLVRHPMTAALLLVAGLLGVASQALDAFVPVSTDEFVAEESLKLLAEPFFLAAYLAALRSVLAASSHESRTTAAPTSQPPSTSVG